MHLNCKIKIPNYKKMSNNLKTRFNPKIIIFKIFKKGWLLLLRKQKNYKTNNNQELIKVNEKAI